MGSSSISVAYLIGTMENTYVAKFQRLLYRISRGSAFVTLQPIEPHLMKGYKYSSSLEGMSGQLKKAPEKSIVLVVFQLGRDKVLSEKVISACRSFEMQFYDYVNPSLPESRDKLNDLSSKIDDTVKVAAGSSDDRPSK